MTRKPTTVTMRNGTSLRTSGSERRAAALALAALCLVAAVTGPVAASGATQESSAGEPRTVVALEQDGDAEVMLIVGFDLTTDAEREAFESFRENQTKREALVTEYGDQMTAVAAGASNAAGREMSVSDPSIAFETVDGGDRGQIVLSVAWSNLAAVEEESLRVEQPFADGFSPEGEFLVVAPDGYALENTSPAPDDEADQRATWSDGRDLDGFEVVAAAGSEGPETGDRLPGFGVPVAVVALLVGLCSAGYRRRRS